MKNILLQIIFLSGFVNLSFGQVSLSMHTIASASKTFIGNNLYIDWTIGELAAVNTISGGGMTFTQGLNQPDKILVGINDVTPQNFNISLYPNPAVNEINLELIGNIGSDILFQILDATGRVVAPLQIIQLNQPITQTTIAVNTLAQGVYFLHLSSENKNFRKSISFIKAL